MTEINKHKSNANDIENKYTTQNRIIKEIDKHVQAEMLPGEIVVVVEFGK